MCVAIERVDRVNGAQINGAQTPSHELFSPSSSVVRRPSSSPKRKIFRVYRLRIQARLIIGKLYLVAPFNADTLFKR